MTEPDPCCDPVPLDGLDSNPAVEQFGLLGFGALWRGERVLASDLADDQSVIETLTHAGRVEVDDDGVLVGIHGLAARPTRHRIEHDRGVVHTWCALDAIGIPAALGINASAVTCCPTCGAELRVRLVDGQPPDDAAFVLWLPGGSCEHLVEDFCNHANLYCDRDHLETAVQRTPGQPITVADAAEIGRHTWGDAAAVLAP